MQTNKPLLGVNIDHIATLRQARGTEYPDPVVAAQIAIDAGAEGITLHLREDRRHIQDHDVFRMKEAIDVPMNLEMAVTEEMLGIAEQVLPEKCCLVPEKREELTTEGGLDVLSQEAAVTAACQKLAALSIEVSLFIDPDAEQIDAAVRCGAPTIEIHTGCYAEATSAEELAHELKRIQVAAQHAHQQGLIVNAGHGLYYDNVQPIAAIEVIHELNIGHGIVARASLDGLAVAVKEMKDLMQSARP